MQRAARRHEEAGAWASLEPDTPFLAPFYLVLRVRRALVLLPAAVA